ncbi:hypothetical protein GGX14DRAFT_370934 [Mycena pura]|uniref:SHSP domain-containing protein n=1 Tax=Mycena pura TaxID=153505 RepID=A0AAD6V5R4_9AGAR|nr:hypothetical protein GGX14DRAFT_370934 [Mycena pura]
MSHSPPIRRLSVSSAAKQEELINAYEAEEERIINVLSKKLEQLKEEKIELENVLEAESESHVNRLTRELSSLRLAQQLAGIGTSPQAQPSDPSLETMLEALQRENESLRSRLVDTERDYVRISRLNEIYREELLEHRNRMGLSVDNLIGLTSSDPYAQPTHQRPSAYSSNASAYSSNASSPTNSILHFPTNRPANGFPIAPTNGVPIPRPATQVRRVGNISEGNTPLSHSPSSSSDSPFPFSPVTSLDTASASHVSSNLTSPPTSYNVNGLTFATPSRGLSYPSVPPPSLSSSFGSPTVSYLSHRDHSLSPVEPQSRRNSIRRGGRVVESGTLRGLSRSSSQSRRESMERRGRVAETGQLVPRSHADGRTLPATTEAPDSPLLGGIDIPENRGSELIPSHGLLLTMSYYADQQGQSTQYPDDYVHHSAPPTPRETTYTQQWDQPSQESEHLSQQHLEQPQQPQQPQQLQPPPLSASTHQPLSVPPPPQPFEDPQHLVPTQIVPRGTHDMTPVRLFQLGQPTGRSPPVEIKPVMLQVDTNVRSTALPGTRPASRARHHQHQHQYHPYPPRPSSAVAHRREIEAHHHVRYASQGSTPQALPMSATHSPAPGRQSEYAPGPQGASPSFVSAPTESASPSFVSARTESAFTPFLPTALPPGVPVADERRYIIRADTHYDPGTRVLTALLELPGLKKRDLTITLATTLFNRVRQVTVNGQSRAPFPPMAAAIRERKYGRFSRAFPVPADTKVRAFSAPEDIDAAMEDGVLVLKIQCGPPATSAHEHEIPIR